MYIRLYGATKGCMVYIDMILALMPQGMRLMKLTKCINLEDLMCLFNRLYSHGEVHHGLTRWSTLDLGLLHMKAQTHPPPPFPSRHRTPCSDYFNCHQVFHCCHNSNRLQVLSTGHLRMMDWPTGCM